MYMKVIVIKVGIGFDERKGKAGCYCIRGSTRLGNKSRPRRRSDPFSCEVNECASPSEGNSYKKHNSVGR